MHKLHRNFIFFMLCLLVSSSTVSYAHAAPLVQSTYTPPTNVTVNMYVLNENTSKKILPEMLCDTDTTSATLYGCSFATDAPYPYTTNPVTVNIEGDYLLDVVPRESNPERPFEFTALEIEAQAITARTYAYYKIRTGDTIDNSVNDQVFVPFFFDRLGEYNLSAPTKVIPRNSNPCIGGYFNANNKATNEQSTVCQAVDPKQYISPSSDDLPSQTEFSADWPNGVVPVLESTPKIDPISGTVGTSCGVLQGDKTNSHGRGMTQLGANRWARGNRCALNDRGNVPWSVRWNRPEQILTHYYTGVHLRDVATKSRLTPQYRWNPLQINWGGRGQSAGDARRYVVHDWRAGAEYWCVPLDL